MILEIDRDLGIPELVHVLDHRGKIQLSDDAIARIQRCREFLDGYFSKSDEAVYGLNTGFGALHDVVIDKGDVNTLQENLVRSHACGMGEEIDSRVVKTMMLLKVQGLSLGYSGVQVETVQLLCEMFNRDIVPVIYSKGSLGASGDLAPLAHMSLPLIGEGEVRYKGDIMPSKDALSAEGLEPIHLRSKEGLALLNGTQFMSAHCALLVHDCERLFHWADLLGALSVEALDGHLSPFMAEVHEVRAHEGQQDVAERVRAFLKGSRHIERNKSHVQDPYCIRCIPQVHGASYDALAFIRKTTDVEINSVTDNPTIFPEKELIISAGNFHGQPLALGLDHLAIAMAEIGSISERRTYKLLGGLRGLPVFLIEKSGLQSGLMITQYTAASIVSENKQLCTPASVDSIDSSMGQEDHVSMGANAATKAMRVYSNLEMILAIELFNAAQAMEFRGVGETSPILKKLIHDYRKAVPKIETDVNFSPLLRKSVEFIRAQSPESFRP
ncbi:MAG: histidine ammonia-lyase [Flavobacteriales bacterium]|nr:histidine ammonia-lyase [Flavobacteriales bacterium]